MAVIRRLGNLRKDLLVANSFFIALSNASMGLLGFVFWIIATRLFPAEQVGLASTLVSAAILIAYASLLGFNTTFVRYLPTSTERSEEINTGLALVFLGALVIGGVYVSVVPSFVPQLRFLRSAPLEAAAIVVFVAFGSVNLVTDAVFVAFRSARYNVLVDGLLQGTIRLGLPAAFVGLGTFGLFASFGIASMGAVTASVLLLMWRFSYRPRLRISMAVLRRVFRFGAANYVAELSTMVPILVLPLVVVKELGPAEAGYFYLALSVANLLFAAALAVGQSLFAEGANQSAGLRELAVRAGRLQLLTVGLAGVLMVLAHPLLAVFGRGYASHATTTLVVLLASAPTVGLKHWTAALLRLRHQLAALVAANLCLAVIPCALAVAWAARGIVWVAVAWLAGNLAAGLAAGGALLWTREGGVQRRPGRLGRPVVAAQAEEVLVGGGRRPAIQS